MPVPNTFASATSAIPLSQLDTNFATALTIGNVAAQLGNSVQNIANLTLANLTISSGNSTVTTESVVTINCSGTINANGNAYMQIVTLADAANITPNFGAGNNFTVTLGGNRTLTNPTNVSVGQSGVVYIVQGTAGSNTLSYGTNWKFPANTAPTLTTTANAADALFYTVRTSNSITVNYALNIT